VTPSALIEMAQGKKLTPEIQWAIVRLSRMLNNDQIAFGLDLSPRSVRRVISYFYEHGTVPSDEEKPAETQVAGNRALYEANIKVRVVDFAT
jgi:transcription initiation factor IIE alpha subunit